ncbi:unnamed protein product [Chilo suppressalis]|uniref:Regucalcin n=1 Tax=Chilo suppressalis TaxID=168631 RepID=A0ABN8AUE4_CHISP|nr:unnamed protein product [Chilo suppressalis]
MNYLIENEVLCVTECPFIRGRYILFTSIVVNPRRLLNMSSVKVVKVTEPLVLGEGPHWDAAQQALFFVDIKGHSIHKYKPATGEHSSTKLGGAVGFIVPVEGTSDQFVVGVERQFQIVQWDGSDGGAARVLRTLGEVDPEAPSNRINDGKADPRGRLFAGTIGAEDIPGQFAMNKASLFRWDGPNMKKLVQGVTVSNGLAWDLKEKAFYYTDSLEYNIRRYDYNVETGEISNMSYVFDFKKNNVAGVPDGSTIDTDGNLWVAVFGGSCVLNVDPRTGKLLRKIPIPALQVTSATFGGPNLDTLYVTSASMNISGEQLPPCGATFEVTGLGVKGHPNLNFKL